MCVVILRGFYEFNLILLTSFELEARESNGVYRRVSCNGVLA